jgi:UDP-glucose:(heptosyl)LPS alpha-1,3-glucosyltransferase
LAGAPEPFRLLVVGGTSDMVDGARRRAESVGVAGRVHLAGRLADPAPAFQAADLFALPSAYESFGLVVLEALAYGLPVLATSVGVVPDVIRDGVNGYVVTGTAQIRSALERFAASPRDGMAEAARATAEEHDWARIADRYVELLEALGARFDSSVARARSA